MLVQRDFILKFSLARDAAGHGVCVLNVYVYLCVYVCKRFLSLGGCPKSGDRRLEDQIGIRVRRTIKRERKVIACIQCGAILVTPNRSRGLKIYQLTTFVQLACSCDVLRNAPKKMIVKSKCIHFTHIATIVR